MSVFVLSVFNLTTGVKTRFPMLPIDGEFTVERPQSSQVTPILGSYPNVQITASGPRKLSMSFELWGEEGEGFWNDFLLPAYGKPPAYDPDLLQIAWGAKAEQAFTGRAIGQPATRHELGHTTGVIFARSFDFELTEINNQAPRVLSVKTGQEVRPATQSYTSRQGDDLYKIARLFNTTVETLVSLNGGNPRFVPQIGSRIVVPKR